MSNTNLKTVWDNIPHRAAVKEITAADKLRTAVKRLTSHKYELADFGDDIILNDDLLIDHHPMTVNWLLDDIRRFVTECYECGIELPFATETHPWGELYITTPVGLVNIPSPPAQ